SLRERLGRLQVKFGASYIDGGKGDALNSRRPEKVGARGGRNQDEGQNKNRETQWNQNRRVLFVVAGYHNFYHEKRRQDDRHQALQDRGQWQAVGSVLDLQNHEPCHETEQRNKQVPRNAMGSDQTKRPIGLRRAPGSVEHQPDRASTNQDEQNSED